MVDYSLLVHMTFTIRVSVVFMFILVELALGRVYTNHRKLKYDTLVETEIETIKYLPPIVQHLEAPEVPLEYEDDDKPSKLRLKYYYVTSAVNIRIESGGIYSK